MKEFYLEIYNKETTLYKGHAISLYLPGSCGDMDILTGHAPLLSSLKEGELVLVTPIGEKRTFPIDETGFIKVLPNKTVVLI